MLVSMSTLDVAMVKTSHGAVTVKQSVEVASLELPVVVLLVMVNVDLVVSSESHIGNHLINTSK